MAEHQEPAWVCPWGICNHDQAQGCRATKGERYGVASGCGSRFPMNWTPEQAKASIQPPRNAGVKGLDHA